MKQQFVIIITLLVIGCNSKPDERLEFQPGRTTSLKFDIINFTGSKSYRLVYNHTLPAGQSTQTVSFDSDTIIHLDIDLNHPLYVTMFDGTELVNFFVIPDDTLHISLDYSRSQSLNELIRFEGITGTISDYLTRERYRFASAPKRYQSTEEFDQMLDSLYDNSLKTLDSLVKNKALPEWFWDLERINIIHEREVQKMLQYGQRAQWYNQFIPRGPGFYNDMNIELTNYFWLWNTMMYLNRIRPDKYDTLLKQDASTDIFLQYSQDNINALKDRLPENVLSYFVASKVSTLFTGNRLLKMSPLEFEEHRKRIDNFLDANSALITDTTIYRFLINEKNRKYQKVAERSILSAGEEAPGFHLGDLKGNYLQLTDFKGKVVLLNFWATWCQPCIRSIPEKNRLAEEFTSTDFLLVNICIDSNYDLWRELVRDNDFKGIHLICKGNWQNILRSNYNIYSVPHYTIIDRNGLIIKNDLKDSLRHYVMKNL